jgi:integrase/recombinase XerD
MTVDAIAQRIALHAARAAAACPNIAGKKVTPHVLRHTCATRMLASGIDPTTIALWLGHESPTSTTAYLHADMAIKQRALDRTAPPDALTGRYQPGDRLLGFLEAL